MFTLFAHSNEPFWMDTVYACLKGRDQMNNVLQETRRQRKSLSWECEWALQLIFGHAVKHTVKRPAFFSSRHISDTNRQSIRLTERCHSSPLSSLSRRWAAHPWSRCANQTSPCQSPAGHHRACYKGCLGRLMRMIDRLAALINLVSALWRNSSVFWPHSNTGACQYH